MGFFFIICPSPSVLPKMRTFLEMCYVFFIRWTRKGKEGDNRGELNEDIECWKSSRIEGKWSENHLQV